MNKELKIYLSLVLVFLIIGSISLYFYQKKRYSDVFFEYSGFAIHRVNNMGIEQYYTQLYINNNEQPYLIATRYNPKDLENIDAYDGLRKDLIKETLYVAVDPDSSSKATIAYTEIDKHTQNPFLFNLPTYPGIIKEVKESAIPIITCNNVSEKTSVILFKIGKENKVFREENGCVILEATNEDNLIMVADRLVLTLLDIMKP